MSAQLSAAVPGWSKAVQDNPPQALFGQGQNDELSVIVEKNKDKL